MAPAYQEICGSSGRYRRGHDLIKFWLHLSSRSSCAGSSAGDDRLKQWKLTDEDWRNRDKRAAYEDAVEEMLERTDTPLRAVVPVEGETSAGPGQVAESVIR